MKSVSPLAKHYDSSASTERLLVTPMSVGDTEFIFELLNTPEWIRFIGNRNITTNENAATYIQKALDNPDCMYWIVRLKENGAAAGIITFMQRQYLKYPDLGFAFLPGYSGAGYAYEAAWSILDQLSSTKLYTRIAATTLPENSKSISLLKRLGFEFLHEIEVSGSLLLLFNIDLVNQTPQMELSTVKK